MLPKRSKVLLVVPPFAAIDYPMLGPSILATTCRAKGIDAAVFYANLNFAAELGPELYTRISLSSLSLMAGEVLFKDQAFSRLRPAERSKQILKRYFDRHDTLAISNPQLPPLTLAELSTALNRTETFVNKTAEIIAAGEPSIVGFSSVFQQNLASIAIARALKHLLPGCVVVLGGANSSSPMGEALGTTVDTFDYIFSGEADHVFPNFVRGYVDENVLPHEQVLQCAPVEVLDETPIPIFSDFFEQLDTWRAQDRLLTLEASALPMETSRGCWWGAKRHCTFCGLNGTEMSYRAKTPNRILREFEDRVRTYRIKRFQITDNIMPVNFRKTVLPTLAERREDLQIFYEVKSNLKSDELDLFVQAGVRFIQPGIESFSSNILRLIDKGVSGTQNLCVLRDCSSRQIQVLWNMLVGIPGDSLEDYLAILELLPYIEHLQPPQACSPIVIDRYSPYHTNPGKYGIRSVAPFPAYNDLYPAPTNLRDLAYHFTGDYDSAYLSNATFRATFEAAVAEWIARWSKGRQPKLYAVQLDHQRLFVEDTRSGASEQRFSLDIDASYLLRFLRVPRRISDLTPDRLSSFEELVQRHLVVQHEGFYTSVVTEPEIGAALREPKERPTDMLARPA